VKSPQQKLEAQQEATEALAEYRAMEEAIAKKTVHLKALRLAQSHSLRMEDPAAVKKPREKARGSVITKPKDQSSARATRFRISSWSKRKQESLNGKTREARVNTEASKPH
jgi:hypothetical protein